VPPVDVRRVETGRLGRWFRFREFIMWRRSGVAQWQQRFLHKIGEAPFTVELLVTATKQTGCGLLAVVQGVYRMYQA